MSWLLFGAGLVLVIEGLVLALVPMRIEDLLAAFARLSPGARKALGLAAVALGVLLVWAGQRLGL